MVDIYRDASYLTIIPRARKGNDSEAMHDGEKNNCFSKIQLIGQKHQLKLAKRDSAAIVLVFEAGAFRYI